MQDSLERKYLKIIQGETKGVTPALLKLFLTPISWLYSLAVSLRNKAYDCGVFKAHNTQIPTVVSVGNIVMGGAGKTPVTMMLSKDLLQNFPIAILSRGYRSHAENLSTPLVLNRGSETKHSVKFCGDEPFLMAQNIPEATIFVGKDRIHSAELAAQRGAKLAILDDGLQHRQLARDFDVVVVDASNPFGQGHLLPRGLLREQPSSLSRADIIVLNNIQDNKHYRELTTEVQRFTSAPTIGTVATVTQIQKLDGAPIEEIRNKKIGMYCGIGNPENFERTLEELGADIVDRLILEDHGTVNSKKLSQFSDTCKKLGAEYIVCTEKDKVKLQKTLEVSVPVLWVKIELEIKEGITHWQKFIKKTINHVNENGGES